MNAVALRWPLSLLASVLFMSSAAFAADVQPIHARHQAWEERLQQRLGLTDQQVQAIREIRARDAADRMQHWQAMRKARAELTRLILIEADEPSIAAKQAEVQHLVAAGVERRVKLLQEITPLLTPEQREGLAQLVEQGRQYRQRPPQGS